MPGMSRLPVCGMALKGLAPHHCVEATEGQTKEETLHYAVDVSHKQLFLLMLTAVGI